MIKRRRKKGQTVVEFAAVVLFILAAFVIFQKYIVRGFSGRWKQVGDAIGQGKIYDGQLTIECAYDPSTGAWFDQDCYEANCQANCYPARREPECGTCIVTTCQNDFCDE